MWSTRTRNTTAVVACATLVTLVAFQGVSRFVQWRLEKRRQRIIAEQKQKMKRNLRRASLQFFQFLTEPWVALCGTVFDVSGDPFFDAKTGGIYASWVRRDVTALLVYGGVIDGRPANETEEKLLNLHVELQDINDSTSELATRRRQIAAEWITRLHSRYKAIGQISDLYAGDDWELLRDQLTPSLAGGDGNGSRTDEPQTRKGKCPMGFGSAAVETQEVEISEAEDASLLREIRFQGRRYDVRGSSLFENPHGALAHFVDHDITHALATQSNKVEDLDVCDPQREYSYEEQLRLEQFRRLFAKELRVIITTPNDAVVSQNKADLHQLIDVDADIEELRNALAAATDEVNAVCPRTTMTPLHKAVEKNRRDLVLLLLHAGADVNAPAALYDDETALQMAQRFNHTAIVDALLEHRQ